MIDNDRMVNIGLTNFTKSNLFSRFQIDFWCQCFVLPSKYMKPGLKHTCIITAGNPQSLDLIAAGHKRDIKGGRGLARGSSNTLSRFMLQKLG